jgi:hypothetical protein
MDLQVAGSAVMGHAIEVHKELGPGVYRSSQKCGVAPYPHPISISSNLGVLCASAVKSFSVPSL